MKKFNNFITIEGPEGSGKSTILNKIANFLIEKDYKVVKTREPGGNNQKFSEAIRGVIMDNHDISPETELLLFEAARKEHIKNLINPSLEEGKIVICDRYIDSSVVYQGMVKGIGKKKVESLNDFTVGKAMPSLTLLIDVEPEVGLKRITDNEREQNRFDKQSIDFHEQVRKSYLLLHKQNKGRIKLINGSGTPEETFEQVKEIIEKVLDVKYN